jgi:hypothetical protein
MHSPLVLIFQSPEHFARALYYTMLWLAEQNLKEGHIPIPRDMLWENLPPRQADAWRQIANRLVALHADHPT